MVEAQFSAGRKKLEKITLQGDFIRDQLFDYWGFRKGHIVLKHAGILFWLPARAVVPPMRIQI